MTPRVGKSNGWLSKLGKEFHSFLIVVFSFSTTFGIIFLYIFYHLWYCLFDPISILLFCVVVIIFCLIRLIYLFWQIIFCFAKTLLVSLSGRLRPKDCRHSHEKQSQFYGSLASSLNHLCRRFSSNKETEQSWSQSGNQSSTKPLGKFSNKSDVSDGHGIVKRTLL